MNKLARTQTVPSRLMSRQARTASLRLLPAFAVLAVVTACGNQAKGPTVANVGQRTITTQEFDAYLRYKQQEKVPPKRRAAMLDAYLERESLAEAIRITGTLDQNSLKAELRELEKEMLISRYFESLLANAVTDEEVRAQYVKRGKEFEVNRVKAAHILVRLKKDSAPQERLARLTEAQDIASKLKAGADFAALAQARSDDKVSGKKGGDLGWLDAGAISPSFTDRVFKLKPGEVSEPFETPFGFHIVRLDEGPVMLKKPYEKVRGKIRYQMREEKKRSELERLATLAPVKKRP